MLQPRRDWRCWCHSLSDGLGSPEVCIEIIPLVTKLQLGNADVFEALLRHGLAHLERCFWLCLPTKQSFGDKRVPKLELGNEGDSV